MLLLGLLPVLLIILLLLVLITWRTEAPADVGESFVFALLGWGLMTAVTTEVLSLLRLLAGC